jgi:hypothetical protein
MPPLTTHLVIGERIFKQYKLMDYFPQDYGAFLLGCILVDVNGFSDIDRSVTHFDNDHFGPRPRGCDNFLNGLEGLLVHPWANLGNEEKAFVLGYFCHLAADEDWKIGNYKIRNSLRQMSDQVPTDVILTEFDVQSNDMYLDSPVLHQALEKAQVPNVLNHVPHAAFQHMWEIVQIHVLKHSSPDTFVEMIIRNGATAEETQIVRQQQEQYCQKADELIRDFFGSVSQRTETMLDYTVAKMPVFWERFPVGD